MVVAGQQQAARHRGPEIETDRTKHGPPLQIEAPLNGLRGRLQGRGAPGSGQRRQIDPRRDSGFASRSEPLPPARRPPFEPQP